MSDRAPDYFLNEGPLTPGDAAVALLVLDDGRYLMQLRDEKPGIFFPGHWGLFGGGLEPGEGAEAALRRELREELGYDAPTMVWFTTMTLDFTALGGGPVERHFFETPLAAAQMERLVLGEGRAMRAFEGPDLLARERVTPYDAFALWMHLTRASHERARRSVELNEEARRLQEFPR
ncbi:MULTISPECIES: NUDIX hydrolase [Methylocystis]|uniref:NUDIX hydrolase n=1 Tax=Methylocystis TaxID=133 RepID=UPI00210AC022|nr:NUDIX domain-containing protein [Methylocystis suflitae]MCQ4188974.1 NUDIX domain-containing protein [Methylocystis suflitae]